MKRYFVPYSGKKPVAVDINGHRLIILSREKDVFDNHLNKLGADRLRPVRVGDSVAEETQVLGDLAKRNKCGVVVAPTEAYVKDVIESLQGVLPWVQ